MAGNTGQPGTSVVSRAVAVLGAFDEAHPRLTLTTLAERAGLPLPTAYRLARALCDQGMLDREADGRYAVGQRLWRIGLLAPTQTGLREVAAPFLQDLYAATLATIHIAVRDGTTVLYLDRISGRRSVPVVSRPGALLAMHATGVGKVLLAHAPGDVRAAALASPARFTPYTITAPERLAAQLDRIRADGYATTAEEMTLGACSVAVPVRRGKEVIAALGIVVPNLSRTKSRLVPALQVAAHGIGRSVSDLLSDPQLSRVCGGWLGVGFPSGRGGVGVQVEACAECRPACPVRAPGGGRAGRGHVLVPGCCAGQRGPGRCRVSLRTLAAAG